jgi:ferredoxin
VRIQVATELCTGHAACAAAAPQVYELDDLGCNVSNGREVLAGLEDEARRGATACPEMAISLEP